jgi:hypothetical protein
MVSRGGWKFPTLVALAAFAVRRLGPADAVSLAITGEMSMSQVLEQSWIGARSPIRPPFPGVN